MDITISVADGVPIYKQIVNQIKYLAASGLLHARRRASADPHAGAAAQGDAEHHRQGLRRARRGSGVIHKKPGSGSFVSEVRVAAGRLRERQRIIEQRIDALLAEAHQLNFTADDVLRVIRERRGHEPRHNAEPAEVQRKESSDGTDTLLTSTTSRDRSARKSALDSVSFHATEGQVYGLVGSNGAGKTTLIKHLLGLLRAATGSVRVFGLDPVRDPVGVLSRVGYLSEERELPEWMRIDELMRYTQAFHPTWDASYARELLETFALDPSKKIKELSKGMRAQAGLIAAVAHRPELLILDEPSSGLDAVVRRDILDAIVRTVADDGRTVIFSSHLLEEVERMSDHVTLMHHGRVTLSGALDDVRRGYQRSRVRFVEHFDQPPVLETALAMEGGGRTWSVVHSGSLEQFHHSVLALGGEVVESRDATLEEIFLARAGRSRQQVEAA